MIRINNIKMPVDYREEQLASYIRKVLKLKKAPEYKLAKVSIDDRKRNEVKYIISVDVFLDNEKSAAAKVHSNNIMLTTKEKYKFPQSGLKKMNYPPVIIGMGPAGLFAGLFLAKAGYKPVIFERGMDVDARTKQVEAFWDGNSALNKECNVQFGEGGAGTFSDGKLNTVIKDKSGRRTAVLETFVEYGADESILYTNKPHLGTDVLKDIVRNIRKEIIRLGGTVHFNSKFADYENVSEDTVRVYIENETGRFDMLTNALILAIGHSARDTFTMLYNKGFCLSQKPFAMGLRIEHRQEMINKMKYGDNPIYDKYLPAADYKLTYTCQNGRSVYSFCMCPGGYVVNASSENNRLCVNGMSYSGRDGINANSAIVVNITPDDFGSEHPLAGMYIQQKYEEAAYKAGEGMIPVQLLGDYMNNISSSKLGSVLPQIKGKYKLTSLKSCLPEYINNAIIEGVLSFDKKLPGYAAYDAVLSGIEARTSSPVRMDRLDDFTSNGTAIYPCGEGAGYAGGITSAAVDGIKVAEAVISKYANMQN
ncbi:MAG: NAD(P)/FAD-dependent oxidoreductase [Coprococcus sp.]